MSVNVRLSEGDVAVPHLDGYPGKDPAVSQSPQRSTVLDR
jgi:hypothetical protein